ncbi:MAG: hypothetical protein V9E90_09025 [Saprospiraceae bacterium]
MITSAIWSLGASRIAPPNPWSNGEISTTFGSPTASSQRSSAGEVLEHLQDDVTAAAEIFRVMAPGGLLLLSVPANPHRYDWVDRWAGHERRYTVDGMSGLLSGAGFEDVKVIPWGFPLTGIYHRWVYRPMLRRRLQRESTQPATAGSGSTPGLAHRALRKAFEIDTRFVGKVPGWFGIIALARKPTA